MLATRRGQSIGDQHQGAITQRRCIATSGPGEPVECRLKPEFAPDVAGRQHRSPVPRRDSMDVLTPNAAIGRGIAVQQVHQLVQVEVRCQQIPPPEIENRAMPRLAVLPISFDHPHIFVLDALAAGRPRRLRDLAVGTEECSRRGSNQRMDPRGG
jgi:hypothetical protein